jgi:hypothetical protein
MKTNKNVTICPRNKATFLHNYRTFYTNAPVFCRILQKPPAFLSLFERWGMNSSPQNVQSRAPASSRQRAGKMAALRPHEDTIVRRQCYKHD